MTILEHNRRNYSDRARNRDGRHLWKPPVGGARVVQYSRYKTNDFQTRSKDSTNSYVRSVVTMRTTKTVNLLEFGFWRPSRENSATNGMFASVEEAIYFVCL